ncbi:MAG: hypothetical protein J0H17_13840 [Rhizobiales bacterium]|nr:hypothetical protein [Hyphomicrobiales bacterium]
MNDLRNIKPASLSGLTPGGDASKPPTFQWVKPAELLIDDAYQRNPSERSVRLIRQIVSDWDWGRFKPPICVPTAAGLECIDGQCTAIAAATHPRVDTIPVMVVEIPERAGRAAAFIGHNRNRIAVTAVQLHVAAVTAGDKEAAEIERACQLAGVTIQRQPGRFGERQTVAVAAIKQIIKWHKVDAAALALKVLADGECIPITATQIRACTELLTNGEYNRQITPERLTAVVKTMGPLAESEAQVFTAAHPSTPLWRALAITWFKNRRAKNAAAEPAPPPPAALRTTSSGTSSPSPSPAADERPAKGRWQPGRFQRVCRNCDKSFTGDKLALWCADCAYSEPEAA